MDFEEQNKKLVEMLKKFGYIKSKSVEQAFLSTPRHLFIPEHLLKYAYIDEPLPIGYGQTISQPSTVAIMTELLQPRKGDKILEIGAGSGWQAAILSRIVGESGKVYTVEIIKELVEMAKRNIAKLGIKNVEIICKDGSLGLPEKAPFDKIIVTAACPSVEHLIEQLKIKGRIVAPVGDIYTQKMVVYQKNKNKIEKFEYPGYFVFVPLQGKKGFKL